MATLLELATIEKNSTDLASVDPDVVAAVELRSRVRVACLKKASAILLVPLPTDPDLRGPALEQLAWAQRVVANPEAYSNAVFRVALGGASPAATVAQILGTSDANIEATIIPILALITKGLHPAG